MTAKSKKDVKNGSYNTSSVSSAVDSDFNDENQVKNIIESDEDSSENEVYEHGKNPGTKLVEKSGERN